MSSIQTDPTQTQRDADDLSMQQRDLLMHLDRQRQHLATHLLARNYACWGVPWGARGAHSRSRQASVSRALARLEQRGLVLRQNWVNGSPGTGGIRTAATDPHLRTTNVLLLPAGIALAARLTKQTANEMLTSQGRAA